MHMIAPEQFTAADILNFAMQERRSCLSDREWCHRLKGYGYDVRQTSRGRVLTTLTGGVDVCTLDA